MQMYLCLVNRRIQTLPFSVSVTDANLFQMYEVVNPPRVLVATLQSTKLYIFIDSI